MAFLNVTVIIVNYVTWEETVECIRSLLQTKNQPNVVVIDNNSGNESIRCITAAIKGEYYEARFWSGGKDTRVLIEDVSRIHLIESNENLGYAGGNNFAIRYSLEKLESEYFWILNNDIVTGKNSLEALVTAMEADNKLGICGSVLLDWGKGGIVQTAGGIYNPFFGILKNHLSGTHIRDISKTGVLYEIDYPVGAALFVRERFITEVGMMDERYFLYYEELDWVTAGKRKGYKTGVALGSRLWHKGSATIGQSSKLNDYFGIRSRILYTIKYYPWAIPFIYLSLLAILFNRARRKQFDRIKDILHIAFNPFVGIRFVLSRAGR